MSCILQRRGRLDGGAVRLLAEIYHTVFVIDQFASAFKGKAMSEAKRVNQTRVG
jgi:hypothetical protein